MASILIGAGHCAVVLCLLSVGQPGKSMSVIGEAVTLEVLCRLARSVSEATSTRGQKGGTKALKTTADTEMHWLVSHNAACMGSC